MAERPATNQAEQLAQTREQLLQKIRNDANLPTLGASVARVVQLASSDGEAIHELACFVLSDVAMTQKILRLANSVFYRAYSGSPVTTISKAIFLLGFDTVKTNALAMLLVESLSSRQASGVRTELDLALSASIFARELSRNSAYSDAEEAAVVALFKNLGRLLVAAQVPALYTGMMAKVEAHTHTPGQAALATLGCSLEHIAEMMLHEWQIPDIIIQALAPLPTGALKVAKNRQEWLQHTASFSASAAAFLPRFGASSEEHVVNELLPRYGVALNLDRALLVELFHKVAEERRVLSEHAGVLNPSNAGAVTDWDEPEAVATQDPPSIPEGLLLSADAPPGPADATHHPSGKPVNARTLLLAGIQDITDMMASGRSQVNDLIMLALETLHRSMGFRFTTVCLRDVKSQQFRARITLGEHGPVRQKQFVFPAQAARDVFHLALEHNADLWVSDSRSGTIRTLIPAWHQALLPDAFSFMILPLVVHQKPLGLFYADRAQASPEGVPADEIALIKTLKGQVIAALHAC